MKRFLAAFPLFVLALALASSASAQVKEIPGDTLTVSGTVEAIDHTSRALTFKNEAGELVTIDVSPEVKRFSEIKVGDKITARYYDNVTVRLKKPGEASVNTESAAATPGKGAKPGATVATQRTMTAVDRRHRPQRPVDLVQGASGMDVQPAGARQERAHAGEGRRPGGLHLDGGDDRRGQHAEEVRQGRPRHTSVVGRKGRARPALDYARLRMPEGSRGLPGLLQR